jgi:flagellar basal-body rod protein FlgB
MNISFQNALGNHADALAFRSRRAEVIANNLINSNTPGYQARDIEFASVYSKAGMGVGLGATHRNHLSGHSSADDSNLLYRNQVQPSIDGNTVDAEIEESAYMRNALEYQASFTILNGRFRGLTSAIRGE